MNAKNGILSLFHHIHHNGSEHKVHHCGGDHVLIDQKLDYALTHCSCGKHAIDKEIAIGHATGMNLEPIEIKIKFLEQCPNGGWHVESGKRMIDHAQ